MAIGATASHVRKLVARQALVPVMIGGASGLLCAIPAGLGMGRLLFEVRSYDPIAIRTPISRVRAAAA